MITQLMPDFLQKFTDNNGNPLAGGLLYTYAAGTSTPLATYTDQTGNTPNTNPVTLDSTGAGNIWLSSAAYKLVLKDSAGNTIKTVDNVKYINLNSIDKTMLNADIAGAGLAQNESTEAFDVQVDDETLDINGDNELEVKDGGLTADKVGTSSKLEVVIRNLRDFSCPGLIQMMPQFEWSNPTLLSSPLSANPAGQVNVAKWSPNGEFLAVGCQVSPFFYIYQKTGSKLVKLPSPAAMPTGRVNVIDWSPCGDYLVIGGGATASQPICTVYQRYGNTFTDVADLLSASVGGIGEVFSVAFSPNSDFLALYSVGLGGDNFQLFQRSVVNTVSGSDLTVNDFTDITSGSGISGIKTCVAWSPDSLLFAGLDSTSGNIDVFQRADTAFTGTTGPDTSQLTGGSILQFKYSPDGNYLVVTYSVSPYVAVYAFNGTSYTLLTLPLSGFAPAGEPNCIAWSLNSEYLFIGNNNSPYFIIYQISNGALIIVNTPALPAGNILGADWSPNKQLLAVGSATTPYLQVYQTASAIQSNALLWTREAPNV